LNAEPSLFAYQPKRWDKQRLVGFRRSDACDQRQVQESVMFPFVFQYKYILRLRNLGVPDENKYAQLLNHNPDKGKQDDGRQI
jgi:hypothetical protein